MNCQLDNFVEKSYQNFVSFIEAGMDLKIAFNGRVLHRITEKG